jgi:hypothetical protein
VSLSTLISTSLIVPVVSKYLILLKRGRIEIRSTAEMGVSEQIIGVLH